MFRNVTAEIMALRGDKLPVSKLPNDGKWPTGTTQYEKRNIAVDIPVWEPQVCIQCGTCSFVCPHATIRLKAYDKKYLDKAPKTFKSADAKGKELAGMKFTVQVAPEDCTGCGDCVQMCPAQEKDANKQPTGRKAINMSLAGAVAGAGKGKLHILPVDSEYRPETVQTRKRQGQPVDYAPVRVFRRLCRAAARRLT